MPITHIHKIVQTISRAVGYGAADKIEMNIAKDDIADAIKYGAGDKEGEVVFYTLNSWINCESQGEDVSGDFKKLLAKFPRKRALREGEIPAQAYHLVQGFDGFIPPQLAHQIGEEFAREFLPGFAVQISTHTNTENIHNHIIFCAVDMNGDRYNDCDQTMNLMRKTSDRICEKYGLDILEGTREYRPIHWIDSEGKQHSYEPTMRKNKLIEQREAGTISADDVSSYRNSQSYQEQSYKKRTEKETVKKDIDDCLQKAASFDEMLFLMRTELGYEIKDKKVNGEWLAHITYCPPGFVKGIRDYKISEDGFYERKNLEYVFLKKKAGEKVFSEEDEEMREADEEVPVFSEYQYEHVDLNLLSEEKRAWKKADGSVSLSSRGDPERVVIRSAKQMESVAKKKLTGDGLSGDAALDVLKHATADAVVGKYRLSSAQKNYAKDRAKEIQDRLDTLHFLEENHITDFSEINHRVRNLWVQYETAFDSLNEAGKRINNAKFIADIPENLRKLQNRMREKAMDKDYMEQEYAHDAAMEKNYLSYMKRYHLTSEKDAIQLKLKSERWEMEYRRLSGVLEGKKSFLENYETYVGIIRKSILGSQKKFQTTWEEFDRIQQTGKEAEKRRQREKNFQTKSHKKNYQEK